MRPCWDREGCTGCSSHRERCTCIRCRSTLDQSNSSRRTARRRASTGLEETARDLDLGLESGVLVSEPRVLGLGLGTEWEVLELAQAEKAPEEQVWVQLGS